jgi:glycosyltransferase involved in cell wall biosynthesis
MRIQFWGDLAGTGFGTVTMGLGRELIDAGHDVRFVSQNDLGDDLPEWIDERTFRITPELVDGDVASFLGTNSMALNPKGILGLIRGELWQDGWRPEAALLLGDFVNVRRLVMADQETVDAFRSLPTYHYVPIEGVDLPPAWRFLWTILRPIAMAESGADEIERITGTRPPVVYHGVDTEQFRPITPANPLYLEGDKGPIKLRSKPECKRFFGGDPADRWVLRTDRFMPRKRYGSLLRAMAPVLDARPDVKLLMHCRSVDEGGHLPDLISKYPRHIAARMLISGFHDRFGGAPRDILTALYNAADVYVSTSAEGFGLTIAEALACGTPAVGMEYSAVPEVIGPGGLLAPVNRLDDNEYDYAWATVDEQVFGARVGELLDNELMRRQLGRKATEHVRTSFSWKTAAQQFGRAMEVKEEAVA